MSKLYALSLVLEFICPPKKEMFPKSFKIQKLYYHTLYLLEYVGCCQLNPEDDNTIIHEHLAANGINACSLGAQCDCTKGYKSTFYWQREQNYQGLIQVVGKHRINKTKFVDPYAGLDIIDRYCLVNSLIDGKKVKNGKVIAWLQRNGYYIAKWAVGLPHSRKVTERFCTLEQKILPKRQKKKE